MSSGVYLGTGWQADTVVFNRIVEYSLHNVNGVMFYNLILLFVIVLSSHFYLTSEGNTKYPELVSVVQTLSAHCKRYWQVIQ